MPGKPWNRHDEKRLRALAEAGNSIQTLAQKPKKYYWTREEEAKLLGLWKKGITNLKVLAEQMNRPSEVIRQKLKRMAVVVKQQKIQRSTTTEGVPKDLAGAVHDLKQRGLDKLELQRLRILVDALQVYDSVLDRISIPNSLTYRDS
jgi:hypothetical protein